MGAPRPRARRCTRRPPAGPRSAPPARLAGETVGARACGARRDAFARAAPPGRAPAGRRPVVGEPEREVDERQAGSGRRRRPRRRRCRRPPAPGRRSRRRSAQPSATEPHGHDCASRDVFRHLVRERPRERAGRDERVDLGRWHPASISVPPETGSGRRKPGVRFPLHDLLDDPAEAVTKRFGDTVAVDATSFCVDRGEVVALLGPSGCGRPPCCGSSRASSGPTRARSRSTGARCREARRGCHRSGAGRHGLPGLRAVPSPDVAENVGFGLPRRRPGGTRAELLLDRRPRRPRASLPAPALGRPAAARRARARARPPELVLLDEPWSNVDPFLRVAAGRGGGSHPPARRHVVLVAHDREEAFSLADRIALMRDGRIVQEGTSEEAPSPRLALGREFVGAGTSSRAGSSAASSRRPSAFPANGASADESARVSSAPSCSSSSAIPQARRRSSPASSAVDVFYRVRLDGVGSSPSGRRPRSSRSARVSIRLHEGRVPVLVT